MWKLSLLVPAVYIYAGNTKVANSTVEELYEQIGNASISKSYLASNCSTDFWRIVNSSSVQLTYFLPTDDAWNRTFSMANFTGFSGLNCSSSNQTYNASLCDFSSSKNMSMVDMAPCLSWLALYHVGMGHYEWLMNSTSGVNITVLQTALNGTNITSSGGNYTSAGNYSFPQILSVNMTSNGTVIQGGGNSTANLTQSYHGKDGHIYLIDRVLFPPLNISSTLAALNVSIANSTSYGNSSMNSNLTSTVNMTYFLPQAGNISFSDLSQCVIPNQLLLINGSVPFVINATNQAGQNISFSVNENFTALINGSATVVRGNIPVENGVLHLYNGTIGNVTSSGVTDSRFLHRFQRLWPN